MVNKDGTIRYREERIKYTPHPLPFNQHLTVEVREQIKQQHELGVKNKILCERFKVTPYMLKKVLEYNPDRRELAAMAREDAERALPVEEHVWE